MPYVDLFLLHICYIPFSKYRNPKIWLIIHIDPCKKQNNLFILTEYNIVFPEDKLKIPLNINKS